MHLEFRSLPHYRFEDVTRLMAAVPPMALARPREALRFLEAQLLNLTELQSTLAKYPAVRYEPLDFAYVVLQNLGALDEQLVQDLTQHYGWRGVVWAGLLTSLSPRAEFAAPLRAAKSAVPHNEWAVDVALAALGEPVPQELEQLHTVLQALQTAFASITKPVVRLAPATTAQDNRLHAQRVREAYRAGGLVAALAARANTSLG